MTEIRFAEFERNLIQERTQAGLSAARALGRVGGRKFLDEKNKAMARSLMADKSLSVTDIAAQLGVSRLRSTVFKIHWAMQVSLTELHWKYDEWVNIALPAIKLIDEGVLTELNLKPIYPI